MLDKALKTNSTQELKQLLSEPNFNPIAIGKRIDVLSKEIEEMQHQAFSVSFKTTGAGLLNVTCPTSGVDIILLQSKIAIRESLIVRLKSLELMNKDVL